jgi:hypothetical protein
MYSERLKVRGLEALDRSFLRLVYIPIVYLFTNLLGSCEGIIYSSQEPCKKCPAAGRAGVRKIDPGRLARELLRYLRRSSLMPFVFWTQSRKK